MENGVPTYGYDLEQAVKDRYLVDYISVESKFKFIEQGIVYDDLSEEDQHRIMIEKVDCLLSKYRRSESEARTVIKKVKQACKVASQTFPVTDIGDLPKL